jgi:CRISPR-associated protein Cmr3
VSRASTSIGLELIPVDTLFFRDGAPSTADSSNQLAVGGVFPPHPATVVGAVRAALARAQGWSGRGRWSAELNEVLGDGHGPDSLGALSFDGPYLLRAGVPHLPVPSHLLGAHTSNGDWQPRALLGPGPAVQCDLGERVRLPTLLANGEAGDQRLHPAGDQFWLPWTALPPVLRGELPDVPAVAADKLWEEEPRTGIERCRTTRTVREGMLYSTRHARPADDVSVGVRVTGVPPDWTVPDGALVPLGGEGRAAYIRKWTKGATPALPDHLLDRAEIALIALSPLDVSAETYRPGGRIPALGDATVVSACLPRPQQIGGWQALPPRPLPLRSALPAGSVLFCEVSDGARLRMAIESAGGPPRIGDRRSWGFGAVALGRWPAEITATVTGVATQTRTTMEVEG